MKARHLIRQARHRAGLTQRELADRVGTHQPVIARWETGKTRPDFDNVIRVVRACGFDLDLTMSEVDDHDLALIRRELNSPPHQRLSDMVKAVNAFAEMERAARG